MNPVLGAARFGRSDDALLHSRDSGRAKGHGNHLDRKETILKR